MYLCLCSSIPNNVDSAYVCYVCVNLGFRDKHATYDIVFSFLAIMQVLPLCEAFHEPSHRSLAYKLSFTPFVKVVGRNIYGVCRHTYRTRTDDLMNGHI